MNARRAIFVLATLVVVLLVINGVIIFVLLRQQAENHALRHALAQERAARMPVTPRSAAVSEVPLSATQSVSIVLGEVNQENGLRQVYDEKDGITAPASIDGVACRELTRPGELAKIHFTVDPSFKKGVMRVWAEVEYFDAAPEGSLSIEYERTAGLYAERTARAVEEWKTATFELTDAEFQGRENGGADFRIIASKPKVFVRRVTLKSE